jgi:hypothetical protein
MSHYCALVDYMVAAYVILLPEGLLFKNKIDQGVCIGEDYCEGDSRTNINGSEVEIPGPG